MSTEIYIVICDEVSVDFREIKPKRLIFRKPSRYTTIFSIRQFSAPQGNVVLITAKWLERLNSIDDISALYGAACE